MRVYSIPMELAKDYDWLQKGKGCNFHWMELSGSVKGQRMVFHSFLNLPTYILAFLSNRHQEHPGRGRKDLEYVLISSIFDRAIQQAQHYRSHVTVCDIPTEPLVEIPTEFGLKKIVDELKKLKGTETGGGLDSHRGRCMDELARRFHALWSLRTMASARSWYGRSTAAQDTSVELPAERAREIAEGEIPCSFC